jgi:hypothetical protein
LARELSTDESPAFVNGVLAKVAGVVATDHPPPNREPSGSAREPSGFGSRAVSLQSVRNAQLEDRRLPWHDKEGCTARADSPPHRCSAWWCLVGYSYGWRLLGRRTPQLISRSASWLGGSS